MPKVSGILKPPYLATEHNIEMPMTEEVYKIVVHGKEPRQA